MLEQRYQNVDVDKTGVQRKIDNVTEGLPKQVSKKLRSVKNDGNIVEIANYVNAMKTEVNVSDNYRACVIKTLCLFSEFHSHTDFSQMTRDDLLSYLDSRRKTESEDPQHRWIGTYNLYRPVLVRFFSIHWNYRNRNNISKAASYY